MQDIPNTFFSMISLGLQTVEGMDISFLTTESKLVEPAITLGKYQHTLAGVYL